MPPLTFRITSNCYSSGIESRTAEQMKIDNSLKQILTAEDVAEKFLFDRAPLKNIW